MNLLNEDNVVHVFLNKLGDIVIANLLFILCCIPVITIGPSLTALYHCMMRTVKGNNNGTTKTFFRAFKENFKQSLIIWLLILAAGAVIILNIRFLLHAEGSAAHMLFYLSVGVLTLLIIFTLYIFPVIATFANTLGALCRNAFLLAFMHFPTTIAIAVITIFPLYMTYLDAKLQPLYVCCWFFFGFGLVAFINSMLLYRFFKLLPPEEDISFCDEKLGKIVIIVIIDMIFFLLFKAEEICEGESTQSCEARFSPSRSPFPGTLYYRTLWECVSVSARRWILRCW